MFWHRNCSSEGVTQQQIQKLANRLTERQLLLVDKLTKRDEILIERAADDIDNCHNLVGRDLAVSLINNDSQQLIEIERALQRIDRGEFGICVVCDEAISPRRLEAVPWAARCVRCQHVEDERRHQPGFEPMDGVGQQEELLLAA